MEILKAFLLEFNKIMPTKVSQKARAVKINGKKVFGSESLEIRFNVIIGKNNASVKLNI